jgi:hypothetical protein
MNTCPCCRTPFGRVRTNIGQLAWHADFCSQACADSFGKKAQQQQRMFQFLHALSRSGEAQPTEA